ncbi:MAG: allophanate hydrolase [Cellvibrionaceae bacterium]|nr:allophanate hydrolase [Cellvibrionaceae bacterium]|tara:strand:- start:7172 stop:8974 length:1803 start_codon:yes stop_codon:yes gene_type:complete
MNIDMSIHGLQQAYAEQQLTPADVMHSIRQRAAQFDSHNIWIHLLSADEQAIYLQALANKDPQQSPLWGIPFAIKDNIDLAGIATTAGCEAFAYTPDTHAQVVAQLIDAGAIPVGKTNLDQFATGLNGTRSPLGPCANSVNPDYISGGSSSGSAVAVALGLASFSLGTDTAGSGRVPACFNNLVGLKPSLGLLSATGLVPACRSLDTISIFTVNSDDANCVLDCAEGHDQRDGYSRRNPFDNHSRHYGLPQGALTVGIIPDEQLQFFGDDDYAQAYRDTLDALQSEGFSFEEIDYRPFDEAAQLLYEGPWVSERYLATLPLIEEQPQAIFPVVREIVSQGKTPLATDLFRAQYRLQDLRGQCLAQLQRYDALLTPTAGRLFTIAEMLEEPIARNSQLGFYTNFMNLLDLSAVSVPTRITRNELPFGITLVGNQFEDRKLLSIANRIQQQLTLPMGASQLPQPPLNNTPVNIDDRVDLVVCGAHLQGLPLNWQLTERGARLKQSTLSAAAYRLYALADGIRPGMVRNDTEGTAIEVEVWSVPRSQFGSFVAAIPSPLGIGKVELADGHWVSGFICEGAGLDGATDISHLGSWKSWLTQRNS